MPWNNISHYQTQAGNILNYECMESFFGEILDTYNLHTFYCKKSIKPPPPLPPQVLLSLLPPFPSPDKL